MESLGTENLSITRKRAVEELNRGREFASQLRSIFCKSTQDHGSVTAEDLVSKILQSFTQVLSVLSSGESGEVNEDPATTQHGSPCSDDQRTEDSGENSKRQAASIDQTRGGYKRRKMVETWIKVTPKPIDDGHSWRKYGQKGILNAKHPRSYFRCTHKHDQGCLATKQIQKTEDETPMYRTTYIGHHTCQDVLKAPQFIVDEIPVEGFLLSFESNYPATKQEVPCFSSSTSIPSIKHEHKEEVPFRDPNKTHDNNQSSSSSLEYSLWSDLPSVLPSTTRSDYGDVSGGYSCTTSSHSSFDMGSVDFAEFKFDALFYQEELIS
ncbi:WRKY DNA-binding transcription factor 70-like isoform X1 [Macadamia integrifolia]|uniref:WRKY DNA-binding transcription factor 70-like isoform X1 n=1 Tax=Macadamia integrifolia TaxID=60698 RepID=UPI001C4ED277|nr:WRKY DNA-binding transcription factor 70-like isoform X1 [Macadamia integrifolia]